MSPIINQGGKRKLTLSQVLSNFLSRTREGKEIIRAFGKNRESASAAIVDYVDQHLKDQPEFQRQLREALGNEEGERFSTLVAKGGHVDQIINAGVVEQLEIHYTIFQDNRQVITFLLGVVIIGVSIAAGYWWSTQPSRMTGDFNIAVAEFSQLGDPEPKVAEIVSNQVFRFLDDQAKLITFQDIQVSHRNIGVITNAEEAKELAKRINAQVVIYGDVTALGDQANLAPQFYIAEAFRADVGELNGQQKLSAPIHFPIIDLLNPTSAPLTLIRDRTVIMTEFTKTLVYLAIDEFALAKQSVDAAIRYSEAQGPFDGQEVLYLFASEIARLQGHQELAQSLADQALERNSEYGRAYIAKANIYYDQGNLFQSMEYYGKARDLPNQPLGAYIVEKASLGIGNSCWVQLQYVRQNSGFDPSEAELEKCAQENYERVIERFEEQSKPETNLREMAAWAYYGIGTLLQEQSQDQEARTAYQKARKLTNDKELLRRINDRLQEMKS